MPACSALSDSVRPHGLQPSRLLCPWNFPGKNTGVGCHFLLQGMFRPGDEPSSLTPPALAAGSLPPHHLGRPLSVTTSVFISLKVSICFSEPRVCVYVSICHSVLSPSPFPYPPDAPGVGVGGSPVVNIWESSGFPGGTSGKEPACQRKRYERCRFNPWVGKIPWRRA